jgi:hypothetical protein
VPESVLAIDSLIQALSNSLAKLEVVRHATHRRCSHFSASRRIVISFFEELRGPGAKEERIFEKAGIGVRLFEQILRAYGKRGKRAIDYRWSLQCSVCFQPLKHRRKHYIREFKFSDGRRNVTVRELDKLVTIDQNRPLIRSARKKSIKPVFSCSQSNGPP